MHAFKKTTIMLGLITAVISFGNSAQAACGPAFDGAWDWGPVSSQGQYTSAVFINNSKNGVVHAQTETGTKLSSGGVILGTILDIEYGTSFRNITAKRIDKNTCTLSFRKAKINKDSYGVNNQNISRRATLKRSGSSLRWCWAEAGHQLGNCVTYQRMN